MMKALKTLVKSTHTMQIGNHAVKHHERMTGDLAKFCRKMEGTERSFTHHGITICMVDDTCRRVHLPDREYKTRSTSHAVNDYRHYFVEAGYQVIEEEV